MSDAFSRLTGISRRRLETRILAPLFSFIARPLRNSIAEHPLRLPQPK